MHSNALRSFGDCTAVSACVMRDSIDWGFEPTCDASACLPKSSVTGSQIVPAAILNSVPEDFVVLSGDDAITLPLIALGGRGVISVVSNEIPAEMTEMVRLALRGNIWGAREIHRRFHPLMEVNFVESNPGPVKTALAEMGLLEPVWRLPLVAPKRENRERIVGVLNSLGLVERVHAAVAN